jgi:hypothetical protein
MKLSHILFAAASIAAISITPAHAGFFGGDHGGSHHSGSSTSGGMPSSPSPSTSGGATSVPEPSDAILLLMGAAGVVIGRRLHARAKRKG